MEYPFSHIPTSQEDERRDYFTQGGNVSLPGADPFGFIHSPQGDNDTWDGLLEQVIQSGTNAAPAPVSGWFDDADAFDMSPMAPLSPAQPSHSASTDAHEGTGSLVKADSSSSSPASALVVPPKSETSDISLDVSLHDNVEAGPSTSDTAGSSLPANAPASPSGSAASFDVDRYDNLEPLPSTSVSGTADVLEVRLPESGSTHTDEAYGTSSSVHTASSSGLPTSPSAVPSGSTSSGSSSDVNVHDDVGAKRSSLGTAGVPEIRSLQHALQVYLPADHEPCSSIQHGSANNQTDIPETNVSTSRSHNDAQPEASTSTAPHSSTPSTSGKRQAVDDVDGESARPHAKRPRVTKGSATEPLKCHNCPHSVKTYKRRSELTRHQRTKGCGDGGVGQRHVCRVCGGSFSRKDALSRHEKHFQGECKKD